LSESSLGEEFRINTGRQRSIQNNQDRRKDGGRREESGVERVNIGSNSDLFPQSQLRYSWEIHREGGRVPEDSSALGKRGHTQ
jgi:hypothetical protein